MKFIDTYRKQRGRAQRFFSETQSIQCPYFNESVVFNADGFHHLRYSARRERNKREQVLKFTLLPLAVHVIRHSGTIQELRRSWEPIGKKGERDGLRKTKEVTYWGLIAVLQQHDIKIRVVLRRAGDGKIIFWSVMPFGKLKRQERQRLFLQGIKDD